MKAIQRSFFTVANFFERHKKPLMKTITVKGYCDTMHPQDFYCDAEKPFITHY